MAVQLSEVTGAASTVEITPSQIISLAPKARREYLDALTSPQRLLSEYGITNNPLRVAHFFAEILHETGGFRILEESLSYRAERLMQVWPGRFPTLEIAKRYARNPEALANRVYGSRMGNKEPGDGFKYRGRGFPMLTGRRNYERVGSEIGVNLIRQPDLVLDPRHSLRIACVFWTDAKCGPKADRDDVIAVREAWNGGRIGLSDVERWLKLTKEVWHE